MRYQDIGYGVGWCNFAHSQVIKPDGDWDNLLERLKDCLPDTKNWMSSNLLKLNQYKTELVVFAPKDRVKQI